ncbi:hypothetical protein Goklo_021230 [Gossypium klotzschianum]|uniref:Hexosyltransferase n=1 Tax=Gossypium klotzschianum TaxID=34286 RepID=A0A7J8UUJ2_9ROSI|nr:hypothetical protein [Gossypium klotzschianum]
MVALVSDGVSDYAKKLLEADGWIVENISLLVNPNQVRPKRLWGVYTKLKIFNMTNYKKVVYLDADTIVVKSIEDLFKCEKFCANLKHSERLNSGVMVVEPSEAVFNDMMSKVNTLPSYTGGDQGFLNSYYSDFPNSHVFDPNIPQEVLKARPVPEMEQLSTLYNADVGLYMLANKWMVDESELRVIHYTLGPLKPWDWWTSWLLKPVDVWQNVRERLEETLIGTGGGKNPNDELLSKVPVYLGGISVFVCFMAAVVPLGISIAIRGRRIVTQLTPVSADTDLFNSDPKKDHLQASSCDIVSWYYGLGMAFLAIVAPSLPCIFGITALFLRLGLMVVGGIILASFMTYASEHLAIRSFLKGCEDRDTTQSRECFLC